MVETILTKICIALVIFLLTIMIAGRSLFKHWALLVLFFIVYFVDNLLIILTIRYSCLQIIPSHIWEGFLVCNWSGKLYSIIFAIALFYPMRKVFTKEDIGFTLRQAPGSLLPAVMIVIALAAWALYVGLSSPKGKPDLQTLLYLAVMPGLNEELVYRGWLLALAGKLVPGKFNIPVISLDWAMLITSILFALLHGFWLDNNLSVHIDIIALRNSFISGLIFAWMRVRTGSLLFPVLAHGIEDFLFFLPRMF